MGSSFVFLNLRKNLSLFGFLSKLSSSSNSNSEQPVSVSRLLLGSTALESKESSSRDSILKLCKNINILLFKILNYYFNLFIKIYGSRYVMPLQITNCESVVLFLIKSFKNCITNT